MGIDTETYKIDSKNYYHTKYKKNQIILAGSLRIKNFHILRLQKKEYGKTKKWCTFSIARDGKVYQHYDSKYYSDFMDMKEIDKHSISIVLENTGMLFYDYDSNSYYNWIQEKCEESNVFEKTWKGIRFWEKYTDKQYDATIKLCKDLCEKHKIPLDSLGFNVHHESTKNFKGIVTRSNYSPEFNDLNPSFDFGEFMEKLGIVYE